MQCSNHQQQQQQSVQRTAVPFQCQHLVQLLLLLHPSLAQRSPQQPPAALAAAAGCGCGVP
jgi:hypothetical protein